MFVVFYGMWKKSLYPWSISYLWWSVKALTLRNPSKFSLIPQLDPDWEFRQVRSITTKNAQTGSVVCAGTGTQGTVVQLLADGTIFILPKLYCFPLLTLFQKDNFGLELGLVKQSNIRPFAYKIQSDNTQLFILWSYHLVLIKMMYQFHYFTSL